MKTPREVIQDWVAAFNQRNAHAAVQLYHEDATNFQVALGDPTVGREAILDDLLSFFHAFPDNFTDVENLFEEGEWAILEWFGGGTWRGEFAGMSPNGRSFKLHGCGFFYITDGRIRFQRGYFDKATWFGQLGIPLT
ncbi:MAG TPA: ester cyclase [Rubrobacteraceae bacterium]